MAHDFRVGSKLIHPYNPELGVGLVREVDGRYLRVFFPEAERELTLSSEAGLQRLVLEPGQYALWLEREERVEIARAEGHSYALSNGRIVDDAALWPLASPASPLERLIAGQLDPLASFCNRVDGLELARLREAGGLGSFLGGRIELFPHQLHTVLQAVQRDPVRWLLADEVGLGKTIEAGLILSALVRTGRSSRALIVTPAPLAVQWLGELYRKFHQVFTLLDAARLSDTADEFGEDFNPFEAYVNTLVPVELLVSDAGLAEHAAASEPDLVVVDEAHRFSDPAVSSVLTPLVRGARHALLLTAVPLQADRRGFFELLALLHPVAFRSFEAFERSLQSGEAMLPCTSAVRRQDLGGLPPRAPMRVDLPEAGDSIEGDPRSAWLAERAPEWQARREKALVFVHELPRLRRLCAHLRHKTGLPVAEFHEALDLEERDIALARFRETDAPLLLCSAAGAEGRNFQFCHRMVHFDLPADPIQLEQQIGRLDRIGRDKPVEIVYFRCRGTSPDLARLYERLGLFARPSAGIDAALAGVSAAIEEARTGKPLDVKSLERAVSRSRRSLTRSAPRVYYPDAYDPSRAHEVLSLVPPDLEERTRGYCLAAAQELGLKVIPKGGVSRYYLEFSARPSRPDLGRDRASELASADWETGFARVDGLPGVGSTALPGYGEQVRFLGTFDREEAIQHQSLAYFANGQMLVEGLMLELEDGTRGRVTAFELSGSGTRGEGLLFVYSDGPQWKAVAIDARGKPRPGWVQPLLAGLSRASPLPLPDSRPERWSRRLRDCERVAASEAVGPLNAVAYFRLI